MFVLFPVIFRNLEPIKEICIFISLFLLEFELLLCLSHSLALSELKLFKCTSMYIKPVTDLLVHIEAYYQMQTCLISRLPIMLYVSTNINI